MALTNKLREAREMRGKSLREVAAAVGIDYSLLSKIERGDRGCPDELKVRLARYFDCPITKLFFVEAVA